jgi:hypothetical protein
VAATGLTASGLGAAYLIAGNGPSTKVANAAADLPPVVMGHYEQSGTRTAKSQVVTWTTAVVTCSQASGTISTRAAAPTSGPIEHVCGSRGQAVPVATAHRQP